MDLSSRDIAVLLWAGVAFIAAMFHKELRESFGKILRAAANRHIAGFLVFLGLWTSGEVLVLQTAGLWTAAQLKDTLIWFAFAGTVGGMGALTCHRTPSYRKAVVDAFKLTALVEFLVALAPFSLPVELVLVPSLAMVVTLAGVAAAREEHAPVRKLLEAILALAGLAIVVGAGLQALSRLESVAGDALIRSFLLPPALSLLFIPALFILVLQARFEWLFSKIQGSWAFRSYARARLALKLGPSPNTIQDFGRRYAHDLPHVRTVRGLERMLRNPPSRSVDVGAIRAWNDAAH